MKFIKLFTYAKSNILQSKIPPKYNVKNYPMHTYIHRYVTDFGEEFLFNNEYSENVQNRICRFLCARKLVFPCSPKVLNPHKFPFLLLHHTNQTSKSSFYTILNLTHFSRNSSWRRNWYITADKIAFLCRICIFLFL